MLGRSSNGTDPANASEWLGVAVNASTRAMHVLMRGNDGTTETTLRTLSNGVLRVVGQGTATTAFLQDSNGALVVSTSIAPPSTLASVHLSNGTNVLIFSASGTRTYEIEQTLIVNDSPVSNDITLSRSTAADSSRVFRGTVLTGQTVDFAGPKYVVGGKPLRGGGAVSTGVTVSVYGRRVR